MQKELVLKKQACCMIVMYILGSTLVFSPGYTLGQDIWIVTLAAALIAALMLLMFSRILSLYPEKDLFEILEAVFGKVAGKVANALICWYGIHVSAAVLRNFADYIQVTDMPETPLLPIAALMIGVIVYLLKSGIETIGKWAVVTFIVVLSAFSITVLISMRLINYQNFLPIMEHDAKTILKTAYTHYTIHFGELFFFMSLGGSLKKSDSKYSMFFIALTVATLLSMIAFMRNIGVLGVAFAKSVYYPSFATVRISSIGEFFARIESIVSSNYLFGGVVNIALCLFTVSKGTARLFSFGNYRQVVLPICLLCLALSLVIYKDAMQLFYFIEQYQFYVIPFQFLIPILTWIFAEIKTRKAKKISAGSAG